MDRDFLEAQVAGDKALRLAVLINAISDATGIVEEPTDQVHAIWWFFEGACNRESLFSFETICIDLDIDMRTIQRLVRTFLIYGKRVYRERGSSFSCTAKRLEPTLNSLVGRDTPPHTDEDTD